MPKTYKRPRSSLVRIEEGLNNLLGEQEFQDLAKVSHLHKAWPNIVGPMLASRSEPAGLEHRSLLVDVDHPVIAQQIRFLQKDIRKACFRMCRITSLTHIRTRVRPGAGMALQKNSVVSRPVTLTEKKKLALELRNIGNNDVRRAIFQARLAQLAFADEGGVDDRSPA
jgi:hypothetical protein